MRRITAIALAAFCCNATHAADFNLELGGAIGGGDVRDAFNADFFTLDARYYFQAVSDSDGPYREAAFVNPASSIALGYANNESERIAFETDSETWQLQGRYHSRSQGWYVSAGLSREESDARVGPQVFSEQDNPSLVPVSIFQRSITSSQTDTDSDNYSLALGYYVGAKTTLSVAYTRIERDADRRTTSCFTNFPPAEAGAPLDCFTSPFSTRMEGEANRWQVVGRHLRKLGHMHLALRGRVGYQKSTSDFERRSSRDSLIDPAESLPFFDIDNPQSVSVTSEGWNAAAEITLYPRNDLGMAISYGYTDIEDVKTKAYGAALEWFVTRSVSVALRYTETDFDNNRGSSDSVALRISGRF